VCLVCVSCVCLDSSTDHSACRRLWQTYTFQGLYRLLFYKKLWLFDALSKATRGTREADECLTRALSVMVFMTYSLLYCPLAEGASLSLSEPLSPFYVLVLRVPFAGHKCLCPSEWKTKSSLTTSIYGTRPMREARAAVDVHEQ